MKRIATLLVLFLTLAVVAAPSKSLVGTFVELEMGDYAHFIVEDPQGQRRSYWVGNDRSFMKFLESGPAYKGRKVRVHWHKTKKNIPEAGGMMEIEEATRVELLK